MIAESVMLAPIEKPHSYLDSSLDVKEIYQCVNQTLTDLLGGKAKETIFNYLELKTGHDRTEIMMRPNELSEILELALGKIGSKMVEDFLVENLYLKLGWKCPNSVPKSSFADFIELTKEGTTALVAGVVHEIAVCQERAPQPSS